MIRRFLDLWLQPASPVSFRATRVLLALQALWLVLSRPDAPKIVTWPAPFFPESIRLDALRYGIIPGNLAVEWFLYAGLIAVLLLVIAGVKPRVTSALAGLLLYHFAPLEEIVAGMPHTFFGGLTVPTLGLLILSFAEQPPRRGGEPSPEYRWPVMLVQLLFSFTYFFAFTAKLRFSGYRWFQASTIRAFTLEAWALTQPVLALQVASLPWLCWLVAIATLIFEASFPLVVFFPRLRRVMIPLAALFHLAIVLSMDIIFTSELLLLLFVNWEWVAATLRAQRQGQHRLLDEQRGLVGVAGREAEHP
jgi:hypothetical protein